MASWGKAPARGKEELSASQSVLDELIDRKGLSLRAQQELRASLRAGNSTWVETLSRGAATQTARRAHSRVKVPSPSPKHGPLLNLKGSQTRLARKPHKSIISETQGYQRDQYVRSRPVVDAAAQRAEDQQLFEHGRERYKEMQQMKLAPAPAPPPQLTAEQTREQLIDQIFREVEERTTFLNGVRAMRANDDTVLGVKMEIATRMAELRRLGVDTTHGRSAEATSHGSADPNQMTRA